MPCHCMVPNVASVDERIILQEPAALSPRSTPSNKNILKTKMTIIIMVIDTVQKAAPKTKDWQAPVKINDKKVLFRIDTGAQCNVMSKKTYNHVSKETLQKSQTRLVTFGGHKIQACGKITLACEHKGRYTPARLEVVEQHVPSILGLKTCTEMNVIKRVDSIAHKPKDMLKEYKDVFTGLGCIKGVVHHIKVDRSHTPVVHPQQRLPVTLRSKVKNELQRMEHLGVVKRVHEPTNWVNSMVIVPTASFESALTHVI